MIQRDGAGLQAQEAVEPRNPLEPADQVDLLHINERGVGWHRPDVRFVPRGLHPERPRRIVAVHPVGERGGGRIGRRARHDLAQQAAQRPFVARIDVEPRAHRARRQGAWEVDERRCFADGAVESVPRSGRPSGRRSRLALEGLGDHRSRVGEARRGGPARLREGDAVPGRRHCAAGRRRDRERKPGQPDADHEDAEEGVARLASVHARRAWPVSAMHYPPPQTFKSKVSPSTINATAAGSPMRDQLVTQVPPLRGSTR